jgi:hypothetical protein
MNTQLDALAAELNDLVKSAPTGDDAAIAASAGAEPAGADNGVGDEEEDGEGKGEEGEAPMAKSFTLTLEDGTEVDAIDGAALIKSLSDRIEANEAVTVQALTSAVDLIKSLQGQVAKLGKAPVPRKTVLTVAERPAAAAAPASQEAGMDVEEFLAKAFEAQCQGKLTGHDVSTAEALIRNGKRPPAHVLSVVMAG